MLKMLKLKLKPVTRCGGVLVALMKRRRPSRPGVFSLGDGGGDAGNWHDPPSDHVPQRSAAPQVRIERVADDFDLLDF